MATITISARTAMSRQGMSTPGASYPGSARPSNSTVSVSGAGRSSVSGNSSESVIAVRILGRRLHGCLVTLERPPGPGGPGGVDVEPPQEQGPQGEEHDQREDGIARRPGGGPDEREQERAPDRRELREHRVEAVELGRGLFGDHRPVEAARQG